MALRPIVVKAWVYLPGRRARKGHRASLAHVRYMGNPKKEELVLATEEMRAEGDDEAAVHARYMGERRGSMGYFGDDRKSPPLREELLQELGQHAGPVWRFFVSVTEQDAAAMGGALFHRPAWEAACRSVVPKMAREMGIDPANLRWVAALHRKEGHPHIHLLVWQRDPTKEQPFLSKRGIAEARRLWAQALYRPERERLGREKAALRTLGVETGRSLLRQAVAHGAPRTLNDLVVRLHAIAEALPGEGRLALAYMPQPIRDQVLATADWLLRAEPALWDTAQRYMEIAREMARHYSDDAARHELAAENAWRDLQQRLAGAVLRAAVALDREAAWREVVESVWDALSGASAEAAAPAVKAAVSRLSLRPSVESARREARALLDHPALAGPIERLLARATAGLPPEKMEERRAKTLKTLEERLARTLHRNAEYVRDYRLYTVGRLVSAWWASLLRDVEEAERQVERLAAEEEAQRKRRAAENARMMRY
jgi:hypothetical protein